MSADSLSYQVSCLKTLRQSFAEYQHEIAHARYPRTFLRCLKPESATLLRSTWRPTTKYVTFDSLLDDITSDVSAREASRSEARKLTTEDAKLPAKVIELLEEDLWQIFKNAQALHSSSEQLLAMALRRATAAYDATLAQCEKTGQYTPIINPLDGQPARDNTKDTWVNPEVKEEPEVTSVRDDLLKESTQYLPYLRYTLLPSVDVGQRLLAFTPRPLYGSITSHKLAIQYLREDFEDLNPEVEAKGYVLIPDAAIQAKLRRISLVGYMEEARDLFDAQSGDTFERTLEMLDSLPTNEDHDVIVPWRAFKDAIPTARLAQAAARPIGSVPAGGKPAPRKVPGSDPYAQFKDRTQYRIPPEWNKFCSVHGYNSTHTDSGCTRQKPAVPTTSVASAPTHIPPTSSQRAPPGPPCPYCKKKGHTEDRCWAKHPELRNSNGHFTRSKAKDTIAVVRATNGVPPPDIMTVVGWDVPLLADRGSGRSLVTAVGAEKLRALDPSAVITTVSETLYDYTNTQSTTATSEITARFTLSSPSLEWAVTCEETFLIVPGALAYPAIIGRTLLDPLAVSNEVLARRPVRPDENAIQRDAIQSVGELCAYTTSDAPRPEVDSGLTPERKQQVNALVDEFSDLFGPLPPDGIATDPFVIALVDPKKTIKIGPRPLSQKMQKIADDSVDELLEAGLIEPAPGSPYSSPILLIPKGKAKLEWRLCIDYRLLNANTITDAHPMPSIADIFQRMAHNKYYAVFDWTSGFHQLLMAEGSRDFTTFVVPHRGLFRFRRMPFGVKNGPPAFQARMEKVYGHLV